MGSVTVFKGSRNEHLLSCNSVWLWPKPDQQPAPSVCCCSSSSATIVVQQAARYGVLCFGRLLLRCGTWGRAARTLQHTNLTQLWQLCHVVARCCCCWERLTAGRGCCLLWRRWRWEHMPSCQGLLGYVNGIMGSISLLPGVILD